MIKIWGTSDDTICWQHFLDGKSIAYNDLDTCATDGMLVKFNIGDDKLGCQVWCDYTGLEYPDRETAGWIISVSVFDEGVPMPPMHLEVADNSYSPLLVIDYCGPMTARKVTV